MAQFVAAPYTPGGPIPPGVPGDLAISGAGRASRACDSEQPAPTPSPRPPQQIGAHDLERHTFGIHNAVHLEHRDALGELEPLVFGPALDRTQHPTQRDSPRNPLLGRAPHSRDHW